MEKKIQALKKLLEVLENDLGRKSMNILAAKKVKTILHGMEKPSRDTLDKLSLLAGFQDWESLQHALHGESDGQSNYEDEQTTSKKEVGK